MEELKKDFIGNANVSNEENSLDTKTKELYEQLLLSRRVLKCTAQNAIEIVSGLEELKNLESQNGRLFLEDLGEKIFVDKIILRYVTTNDGQDIVYWSPCNIIDFFIVSGIKFNSTGTSVFEFEPVNRSKWCYFYGKDIIKSLMGDIIIYGEYDSTNIESLQKVLQAVVDQYINTDRPINTNTLYRLFMNVSTETGEIYVGLKNRKYLQNTPKATIDASDNRQKTVIHLER